MEQLMMQRSDHLAGECGGIEPADHGSVRIDFRALSSSSSLVVTIEGRLGARDQSQFRATMLCAIESGFRNVLVVFREPPESIEEQVLLEIRSTAADTGVHLWSMSSRSSF